MNRLLALKLQQAHGGFDADKAAEVAGAIVSQYEEIPTGTILDQLYRNDAGGEPRALGHRNDDLRHQLYDVPSDWRPADPSLVEGILFLAYTLKAPPKSTGA